MGGGEAERGLLGRLRRSTRRARGDEDAAPDGDPAHPRAALLHALREEGLPAVVVDAVAAVPRAPFVPAGRRADAWEDRPLPIGEGQTISQPSLVARMCALLEVRPGDRVLDVGCGSGYHAALLARLGAEVVGVERHPALAARARTALAEAGVAGVRVLDGDGSAGVPGEGPFDAINVAAASPGDPAPGLVAQLAVDGRLLAPVGEHDQRLVLLRRTADGVRRRELDPVRFVPLVTGPPDRAA